MLASVFAMLSASFSVMLCLISVTLCFELRISAISSEEASWCSVYTDLIKFVVVVVIVFAAFFCSR